MNKGFKNYTKRITQAVGNVAEVSVNVNKTDSNIHVTMPLVSTIGKCPIATSLIFDFQSRGSTFGFGKGARLNYYSLIAGINGGFQITIKVCLARIKLLFRPDLQQIQES